MNWTDEQCDRLLELWADGWSSSQIARELGVTRNAIIGKVNRLKPPAPAEKQYNPRPLGTGTSQSAMYRRRKRQKQQQAAAPRPSFPPPKSEPVENPALLVSFMQLEHHHCRWPIGDDPASMMFCGADRSDALPYCAVHARMSYRKHVHISQDDRGAAEVMYHRMAKMRAARKAA